MIFKEWLLLNENIEENFEDWLKILVKYAKPNEKEKIEVIADLLSSEGETNKAFNINIKKITISVLKEKNLQNFNWFSFCMGYFSVKHYRKEDLELAIDVTKRMIDSREITKPEIGQKGWFKIGEEAKGHVDDYLLNQQRMSNRSSLKMKKKGETTNENSYISLVAQENDLKLYHLRGLYGPTNINLVTEEGPEELEKEIKERKFVLCKYGKGTKWCTANPTGNYDRAYAHNNIFIVHKNDEPIYQFTSCKDMDGWDEEPQFMDVDDNNVDSLTSNVYKFLNKYAEKETRCFNIEEDIDSVESFASKENIEKVSNHSILKLMKDKESAMLVLNKILEIIKNSKESVEMSIEDLKKLRLLVSLSLNTVAGISRSFDFKSIVNELNSELSKLDNKILLWQRNRLT